MLLHAKIYPLLWLEPDATGRFIHRTATYDRRATDVLRK